MRRRHLPDRRGRVSSSTASRSHVHSPRDAAALGIEIVYQDLALCDNLDIVQNMFLGRETHAAASSSTSRRWSRWPRETLASLSVRTVKSVRQQVASLSGGQRQTVAIAKAVLWNSKVVILDEPTAALGVAQTAQVLELVRRLADNGLAVVLISHNMNDVFAVSDRIAALYLGRMAAQVKTADVTHAQVVELITAGRSGDLGLAATSRRRQRDVAPGATMTADRDASGARSTDADSRRLRPRLLSSGYAAATWARCPPCSAWSCSARSSPSLRPVVPHRRSTSPTCSPRAPRSPSSRWAWSSCCCSARSTCPPASPAASAPRCWRSCSPTTAALVRRGAAPRSSPAWSSALVLGTLVAKVGIPSFVVTLAAFLAFQGVVLLLVKERHEHLDPRRRDPRHRQQEPAARARLGRCSPSASPATRRCSCCAAPQAAPPAG